MAGHPYGRALVHARLRCDFRREVILTLLDTFAQRVADEATYLNVLAKLRDVFGDEILDLLVFVTEVRLLKQAHLFKPLPHTTGHDAFQYLRRLAGKLLLRRYRKCRSKLQTVEYS